MTPMPITWESQATPLTPAAVLARGRLVPILAAVLAEHLDHGVDLDVHATDGHLLAIGEERDLPWVDGATWLGRYGSLLVPTTLRPSQEASLVARAVARRTGGESAWVVLLPDQLLTGSWSIGRPDTRRLRQIAERADTR
jgi:hypothetical protein